MARELGQVIGLDNNESELFFVMEEYREKSRVRFSLDDLRDRNSLIHEKVATSSFMLPSSTSSSARSWLRGAGQVKLHLDVEQEIEDQNMAQEGHCCDLELLDAAEVLMDERRPAPVVPRRAQTGTDAKILILTDYYLPGYKGGGPMRTLSNMVDRLGNEYRFRVVTRDRDLGETEPYQGILADFWLPVGKAGVCYLPPWALALRRLRTLFQDTEHDAVYLNSFFSPAFTIKPLLLRRLGLIPGVPFILATREEFFPERCRTRVRKNELRGRTNREHVSM